MPNLLLEIRVCPKCNRICVNVPGNASALKHHGTLTHRVAWKRGNGEKIVSWKVWLVDENGDSLPANQSPFEDDRVEFGSNNASPDGEKVRGSATLGEYEYKISCVLDDGSTVDEDPILVISDAERDLEKAVEEIDSKLDRIKDDVQALSRTVDRLAQEVARIAGGRSG